MSLVGIIGTDTSWVGVCDPAPEQPAPKLPWWRQVLGLGVRDVPQPQVAIRRTDFRDLSVTSAADRLVAASVAIGQARAVGDGVLGDPNGVRALVVRNLIAKLTDALEADQLLSDYAAARKEACNVPGSQEIIAQLDTATAEVREAKVAAPVQELEVLADQMKLLDLWMMSPKVQRQLGAPAVDSFEDIAVLVLTAKDIASASQG